VLDLPQLHQKPSASSLLTTLCRLAKKPSSWDVSNNDSTNAPLINEGGIPAYLTRIIMSPLDWLASEGEKEGIWEAASKRLAERSGRTAMPSVSRTFQIPTLSSFKGAPKIIDIKIHEPSLTGDNLGHKTWVASYLLAKRLPKLISSQSSQCSYAWTRSQPPTILPEEDRARQANDFRPTSSPPSDTRPRILELGAGTGLVGLTASALISANIHLTDLPAIVPNLQHNIQENASLSSQTQSSVTAFVLDWSSTHPTFSQEEDRYDFILAADSLYAPEHARWLARTMGTYLRHSTPSGRILVELPFREAEPPEHKQFRWAMSHRNDMEVVAEGEEIGFDDWGGGVAGERVEVRCWWSVWKRRRTD